MTSSAATPQNDAARRDTLSVIGYRYGLAEGTAGSQHCLVVLPYLQDEGQRTHSRHFPRGRDYDDEATT